MSVVVKALGLLARLNLLVIFFVSISGCGQDFEQFQSDRTADSSGDSNPPPPPPPPPDDQISAQLGLSGSSSVLSSELGQLQTFQVTVNSENGFSGPVSLSINRGSLDSAFQAGGDILISVSPSLLNLTAGGSATATVTVDVRARAPSMNAQSNGYFKVVASSNWEGSPIATDLTKNLVVSNVFRIKAETGLVFRTLYGGVLLPSGQPTGLAFRRHTVGGVDGVTLIFVNMDSVSRTIHGNSPIQHQSGAMSPNGGEYSTVVLNNADPQTGSFYFHGNEPSTSARSILFSQNP